MNYLLDTHIFLWWLNDDKNLKKSLRNIISDPKNRIYVSVINGWEISIKNKLGKLPLKTTLKECFEVSGFEVLSIGLNHILTLDKLPLIHNDPFDRLLIAQAMTENLILLTDDRKMEKYEVKIAA